MSVDESKWKFGSEHRLLSCVSSCVENIFICIVKSYMRGTVTNRVLDVGSFLLTFSLVT